MVSVLSYFANRVPTQIQFAQLGPATQHILQLLHTHKSRENPTEEIFCYFFCGGGVVSPGNDPSVNAASPASASLRQI